MTLTKESLQRSFLEALHQRRGKTLEESTPFDQCVALAAVIREYVEERWEKTRRRYQEKDNKQIYYISMEFLPGKMLRSHLYNLGLRSVCEQALADLGVELAKVEDAEQEPGLGSGGLGRLAASFLDTMASLRMPGHGFGLKYEHGYFIQRIVDGRQVEIPDNWSSEEQLWGRDVPEEQVEIRFGGSVEVESDGEELKFIHKGYDAVCAVAWDIPITGYRQDTVNTLRLWRTKDANNPICHVLYPDDSTIEGRRLRLQQEYLLVSASVQSIVREHINRGKSLRELPDYVALHINDTHPALVIPEFMRILLDEHGFGWEEAWEITTNTVSYTNHTTLSEAMELWPVRLLSALLPRLYMIIGEINERFCQSLWERYPGEWDRIASMAIIAYGQVRMAHLAVVGSHSINGVSKLHSRILRQRVLKDFWECFPEKFNNKTNGISHRRWLLEANPKLAALITEAIGDRWITKPVELEKLPPMPRILLFKGGWPR